jgi:diguanylate cyclase (GGDEF)-like protein
METPIGQAVDQTFALASHSISSSARAADASHIGWLLRSKNCVVTAVLAALILTAAGFGIFSPIDNRLEEFRFNLLSRSPTGNVVFVNIDAASLQAVGVWPWPRTVHAAILDRLSELGAKSVSFDIDFSAASTPESDSAFAAALKRAGGFVALGAFEQNAGAGADKVVNMPIPELAEESDIVAVDVPVSGGDVVRDYPASRMVGGRRIPSLGQALGRPGLRGVADPEGLFGINYAIDANAIDRISAADLLAGKIAAERLRGRDVVIGASAQELRDFFVTPRFGLVPGGLIHILAAETLTQGVMMHDAPWPIGAGIIIALALIAAGLGHRLTGLRWLLAVVVVAAATELGAFWLQRDLAMRVSSAPIHVALLTFVISAIVADLVLRRKLHAQASREREFVRAMLRQVITDDFDGVVIVDEVGNILANSRVALEFLKGCPNQATTQTLPPALAKLAKDCFAAETADQSRSEGSGQISLVGADGALRYLDYVVTVSSVDDEFHRRVACLTFRDVTQRRAEQEKLKFLASHDSSTGAWLRHELIRNMQTKLDDARHFTGMTLILIELRRFSSITNAFGDAVGEDVIQSVLARLHAEGHEMVARIGDANFGLAVPNLQGQQAVSQLCQSLIAQLSQMHQIDERNIPVGVDLGVAIATTAAISAEALLVQARIAQAVARGGAVNHFEIFLSHMEAEFREREWIETALRQALVQEQFTLNYQPQFDLASGECIGAEALIRWHHPERGMISPAKFIPIAEESRLILDIGRWVMQTACRDAARWSEHLNVAINVSAFQLGSPQLLADLHRTLERSGLSPKQLTIEITESAFVSGATKIVTLLNTLRARGISIALDDFGTGYSSLSYLDLLPLDKIKIDQSFVQRMLNEPGAAAIVQTVLQLAEKLGKTVVAEGVETAEQARFLQKFGCQSVQGYYFGRPMSATDFHKTFATTYSTEALERRIS